MNSKVYTYINMKGRSHPSRIVTQVAALAIRVAAKKYFKGKLLDIGCGEKHKNLLVGDLVTEHIGLDHQDTYHDKSKVDIFGTAYDIPVNNAAFDSVLCTAVLEHLEEPQKALDEAFRVLKPGGYAIYTMPLFWHLHEEPRDFFRYTKYGLQYLFERSGFEIIEIKPMGGFWITIISEWNYYLQSFSGGFIKSRLIKGIIRLNNLLLPYLDSFDRKFPSQTEKWTWMYLVSAKKL